MDVILPFKIKNEKKFFDCAFKMGIDEMSAHKFIYITQLSDLDIFPKMGDERLNIVLYLWEMCEDYKIKLNDNEWELPEELETMLKLLVPWSLDLWFSKEWDRCKPLWKHALIHCLNRARGLLMRLPDMMQINWDFLLLYNLNPWQVVYLKTLNVTKEKTLENGALTIETEEKLATNEDIAYLKLEQLPLIVLRLVKLFDQSSIDMVKTLCMRVIAAWNKVYYTELNQTGGSRLPYVPPEDKRCLLLICHIYLMATYESDDVKGYVIDNMIYNIRFYNQGFQTSYAMDNMKYTPARFIALTCLHLRLQKREFFDFFIWNSFDTSPANLFGVVSQAYKSYLLGNLLMELNQMNEDDFASNIALYKRLVNAYVNEREKSELFIANELQKHEAQRYAHNVIQCVQNMTDFKSKICKGNRMSNIGNYENTDEVAVGNVNAATKDKLNDKEADGEGDKTKDDLRVDPIFQNIPNNEEILYYVHEVLSKKTYQGWHFAKIVLLFKIISHELNMIETWRYHPGLTTGFMLNLETKLSHHYTDLAKIFIDHPFIEQEFWLTAFYLNPTNYNYEAVKRLGIRNNRKRTDDQGRWITGKDKIEAKYGLLSSTIDVKEITNLSNTDEQRKDYEPLFQALSSLHLPASMVKDIITVVFLARNKSFSWAVDWNDLRRRCKMLMSNAEEKKRFVELNMAEANDRLKFLNIDYEKYKNRPQLDYGTIEQGYENLINAADMDDDSEESEEEDDFEDDEDVYETKKGRSVKKTEIVEDDNSQEDDPYLTGKRRTRARAAAAMASILFNSEMGSRRKRRKKDEDEEDEEKPADNDEKSNDSKSANESVGSAAPSAATDDGNPTNVELPKKNIKECLRERPVWVNPTDGFQPLIDMWNVQSSDLEVIDGECVSLFESSSVLHRFAKLKYISKGINPAAVMSDEDGIREMEMLTRYEDIAVAVKQEKIDDSVTLPLPIPVNLPEGVSLKEEAEDMKVPELTAKSLNSEDIEQSQQEDSISTKDDVPVEDSAVEDHNSCSVNNDATITSGTITVEQETKEVETAVMVKQETKEKKDNIEEITEEMLKSNAEEPTNANDKKEKEDVVAKEIETEKDQDQPIISEHEDENKSTTDKVESLMETQVEINSEELKEDKTVAAIDTTTEATDNATVKPSEEGTENQFELPELIIKPDIEMNIDAATTTAMDKVVVSTTDSEQSPSNEPESKEEEKNITESNVNKDDLCEAAKILETSEIEDMEINDNKVLESAEVSENDSNEEKLQDSHIDTESKDNKVYEHQEKSPSNDNNVLELEEKSESNDDKVLEESEKTDDREIIESQENLKSNDEKVLETLEPSEKLESNDCEVLESQEKSELNDDKVVEAEEKSESNVEENLESEEKNNSNNEKSEEAEEKLESTNQKALDSTENSKTNDDEIIDSQEILESNNDKVSESQEKLESIDDEVSELQENLESIDDKVSESQEKLESNDDKISEPQEKLESIDDRVSESQEKMDSDDEKVSESQEKIESDDDIVSESQDKMESDDDKVSESQEHMESKDCNVLESQEMTGSKEESVAKSQGISQEYSNNDDISESQEMIASNDEKSLESHDIIKLNDDKSLKSPEICGFNEEDDAPDSQEKINTETKDEKVLETATIKLEPLDIKKTPNTDDDDDNELDIPEREETPSEDMQISEPKISSDSKAEIISGESKEDKVTEECPKIKSERCTDEKANESAKSVNKLTVSKKPIIEAKEPEVIIILDDDDVDDDEEVDTKQKSGHGSNMPLLDSEESNSAHESGKRSSKNIITKPLKVLLRRLRPSDVVNLRQPKVRLKRIKNPEFFLEEFKAKRRRFHRRVYIDIDESSDNSLLSNSSSSDAYRPPAGSRTKPSLKRHILRKKQTSDSDADSIRSQINTKSRRLSTSNASSNQSARSSSRSVAGNLVVTPRSASGLKLRISHAIQRTQILHGKSNLPSVDEIIQLSSSSNDTNTMDSIAEVVEMAEGGGGGDPLFEEEIVI